MDMAYEFDIKHIMHAVVWKLNAMINKDKSMINELKKIGYILRIWNSKVIVFDHLIKQTN